MMAQFGILLASLIPVGSPLSCYSACPQTFCVSKISNSLLQVGARCGSVVRAFAHGAMGRRIDPSWGGPH